MKRFLNRIANVASLVGIAAAILFLVATCHAEELCGQSDLPLSEWNDAEDHPTEAFRDYLIECRYKADEGREAAQILMDADFAKAFERSGR